MSEQPSSNKELPPITPGLSLVGYMGYIIDRVVFPFRLATNLVVSTFVLSSLLKLTKFEQGSTSIEVISLGFFSINIDMGTIPETDKDLVRKGYSEIVKQNRSYRSFCQNKRSQKRVILRNNGKQQFVKNGKNVNEDVWVHDKTFESHDDYNRYIDKLPKRK